MRRIFVALWLGAACGGGGEDTIDAAPPADARPIELGGACPLDEKVGRFEINNEDGYGAVTGLVESSVNATTILQPAESDGSCRLMRRVNPFCDPPCDGTTQTCGQSNTCVPVSRNLRAGTITIDGLLVDLALEPLSNSAYSSTSVPNPPFAQGAAIRFDAAGDEVGPFALEGSGVEPLEVAPENWVMAAGTPMTISWTASSGPGDILVTLNVDQHGAAPVTMFCEFEDTGSGTIPVALIDTMIGYGYSGFASGNIYRRTIDRATITQGCVELSVHSHRQHPLVLQTI